MNEEASVNEESEIHEARTIGVAFLKLPYIPDFILDEVQFWFAPTRREARAVYHELLGASAKSWTSYYTKKGWAFLHADTREAEGPYRVKPGETHIEILEPGRIFAPKPLFQFDRSSPGIPIVSLEKRRPLNPWKPNYIAAVNFIKRYEWPHPLPRSVSYAIWEIEECGQIAGSLSWKNGEAILRDNNSAELRSTLADIFYNRPEDYPLGSEVYLRTLGLAGPEGFEKLTELAAHPVSRKRKIVAQTLGELRRPEGVKTLLLLLDDEDPDVRTAALRAIGRVGVNATTDPEGKVAEYLQSPDIPKRVWAAQSLLNGGDESQEKFLITLVKEEPRLLTDMGELGDVLGDLGLTEAVPFCINRLKSEKPEFRADAAEALAKITGLNIEYQSLDTDEQRRNAIRTYSRWWEDTKRERRKSR